MNCIINYDIDMHAINWCIMNIMHEQIDIKLTTVQWASERETADMQHEGHRILQQQNMSASRDRDARIILTPYRNSNACIILYEPPYLIMHSSKELH